MFDAYGKVDDAIHQSKDADYPAVAEQLNQSMTAISSLLASPPPAEEMTTQRQLGQCPLSTTSVTSPTSTC